MYSLEHLMYLREEKKKIFIIRSCQILITLFFLLLWQLSANMGWINTFITSSPLMVAKTIIGLHSNGLYQHIIITIYETLISFILGTLLGCFIATILWWNKYIYKIIDPYLIILNSLPKIALGPIIIIWFGAGMRSIIIMSLLISVIITIITVSTSFNETDINKLKLMQSFKANKRQTFFKLVLPSSLNNIISSLKINISMSLIGVIMGEFLVSKEGLGYLIMYGSQIFNLNLVVTGIFLLCIVATIMYYIVLYIEKKLIKN